ncbi:MAG: sugar phosphate isomerase/epimerase [Clostridia bacterium]|nr:sugar phosphate isomerase/epimerase [Clostridia bacterium]
MVNYNKTVDLVAKFRKCQELGINSCQLSIWDTSIFTSDEYTKTVKNAIDETGIKISSLWAGYSGPCEWNFTAGPDTIGLVPVAYRHIRLNELKSASDFAQKIGVSQIATHVGFIPENPNDPEFNGLVVALRNICSYMKSKGQYFLFETGQETPTTLLRTIQAVGADNMGINLDTANVILYGRGNPVDALDVFGKYVMDTHIKDGFFPTNGMYLGKECRAGDGKANIPAVVVKLISEYGYEGPFTIEREISGDQQTSDILHAKKLVEDAIASAK